MACVFLCEFCSKMFSSTKNLQRHLKFHEVFACRRCEKTFKSSFQLKHHQKRHNVVNLLKCKFCSFRTRFCGSLMSHIENIHIGTKPFRCKQCHLNFELGAELNAHIASHDLTALLVCSFCSRLFSKPLNLNLHLLKNHNVKDIFLKDSASLEIQPFLNFELWPFPIFKKKLNMNDKLYRFTSKTSLQKNFKIQELMHLLLEKYPTLFKNVGKTKNLQLGVPKRFGTGNEKLRVDNVFNEKRKKSFGQRLKFFLVNSNLAYLFKKLKCQKEYAKLIFLKDQTLSVRSNLNENKVTSISNSSRNNNTATYGHFPHLISPKLTSKDSQSGTHSNNSPGCYNFGVPRSNAQEPTLHNFHQFLGYTDKLSMNCQFKIPLLDSASCSWIKNCTQRDLSTFVTEFSLILVTKYYFGTKSPMITGLPIMSNCPPTLCELPQHVKQRLFMRQLRAQDIRVNLMKQIYFGMRDGEDAVLQRLLSSPIHYSKIEETQNSSNHHSSKPNILLKDSKAMGEKSKVLDSVSKNNLSQNYFENSCSTKIPEFNNGIQPMVVQLKTTDTDCRVGLPQISSSRSTPKPTIRPLSEASCQISKIKDVSSRNLISNKPISEVMNSSLPFSMKRTSEKEKMNFISSNQLKVVVEKIKFPKGQSVFNVKKDGHYLKRWINHKPNSFLRKPGSNCPSSNTNQHTRSSSEKEVSCNLKPIYESNKTMELELQKKLKNTSNEFSKPAILDNNPLEKVKKLDMFSSVSDRRKQRLERALIICSSSLKRKYGEVSQGTHLETKVEVSIGYSSALTEPSSGQKNKQLKGNLKKFTQTQNKLNEEIDESSEENQTLADLRNILRNKMLTNDQKQKSELIQRDLSLKNKTKSQKSETIFKKSIVMPKKFDSSKKKPEVKMSNNSADEGNISNNHNQTPEFVLKSHKEVLIPLEKVKLLNYKNANLSRKRKSKLETSSLSKHVNVSKIATQSLSENPKININSLPLLPHNIVTTFEGNVSQIKTVKHKLRSFGKSKNSETETKFGNENPKSSLTEKSSESKTVSKKNYKSSLIVSNKSDRDIEENCDFKVVKRNRLRNKAGVFSSDNLTLVHGESSRGSRNTRSKVSSISKRNKINSKSFEHQESGKNKEQKSTSVINLGSKLYYKKLRNRLT